MPAGTMDALGAFSHLTDNLPDWISRLSDLTAHTAAKNAEYVEAYKQHATVKPRRRKNSSICSIRTDDLHDTDTPEAPHNPRKRGIESSSIDSDDRRELVSTRHNVVIHYDGHTQKSLEDMVRYIGTARNNIRRGKMSLLPFGGFGRGGAFGRNSRRPEAPPPLLPSEDNAPEDQLLSTIRNARARGPPPPVQGPAKESSFDLADKQLELAHSMCETAAYHFLRSGDCSTELTGVEEKFRFLHDLATSEVQRLKSERSEESEGTDVEEESTQAGAIQPIASAGSDKPTTSFSGEIEVDDGSDSVESLDLAAFRANRLRR